MRLALRTQTFSRAFPEGISRQAYSRLDISITQLEPGILEQTIAVSAIAPQDEPNVDAKDDLNVESAAHAKDEPKREAGKENRFPRSGRLLRHADFERVYKQGRRHFSPSMTFFYLARMPAESVPASYGPRVGFTVGRALGGAVVRNRMKRRLREAVRLAQVSEAGAVDVVINPKKSLLVNDFEDVLNEVRRAFVIIQKKMASGAQ